MNSLREKLFEEVRTRRELSYAPSAGLAPHGLGEGYLYVTAVDIARTQAVMQEVVRDYQAGRIIASASRGTSGSIAPIS